MKYYLIVGEASGDLHASHLMAALQAEDPQAEFRFFGGDLMTAVGGTRVKHYKELAYMGFVPVLLHLRTIFAAMKQCKADITAWRPDVVILVDYPGFNLKIARYVHAHTHIPVYYYISPKIWAWKEYRIKNIKRDVDELFSILPFEVDFFENKHDYPIHYVGNPTVDEIAAFKKTYVETFEEFSASNGLSRQPQTGNQRQSSRYDSGCFFHPRHADGRGRSARHYLRVLSAVLKPCSCESAVWPHLSVVGSCYGCFGHFGDCNLGDSSLRSAASRLLPYPRA